MLSVRDIGSLVDALLFQSLPICGWAPTFSDLKIAFSKLAGLSAPIVVRYRIALGIGVVEIPKIFISLRGSSNRCDCNFSRPF